MAEVEVTRQDGVLTLTLNRPDVLNAFDSAMHRALAAGLEEAAAPELRAVVVTGAGRGFCVGQDLAELRDWTGGIAELLHTNYHPNVLAIRALEKPVIAAVNGPAAGAGLSLACACDIRVAAESATFVPAFVGVGLVPDSGGSLFVSRLLGQPRAFEWLTSNRRLSATEAKEWGLVGEVVADADFASRVDEIAARWAEAPTLAVGYTKRLIELAGTATIEQQLEVEAELQAAATATDDYREGVAAFLEKRPPRFSGR